MNICGAHSKILFSLSTHDHELTMKMRSLKALPTYEVCKLCNEMGNVAFDQATPELLGLEWWQRNM
jgi:hypothetical protein